MDQSNDLELARRFQDSLFKTRDELDDFAENKPVISTCVAMMMWLRDIEKDDPEIYESAELIFKSLSSSTVN